MTRAIALALAAGLSGAATAAPEDWAEGSAAHHDGATRDHYNRAAHLRWKNKLGDWHDAKGAAQGDAAYATAAPKTGAFVEWDVTALVREWADGTAPDRGFLLRVVEGKGDYRFASREDADPERRPQLVLTGEKPVTLAPVADTHLDASTADSLGHGDSLRVSNRPNHALLRFDLAKAKDAGKPAKAVLRLFATRQTSGSKATVGVFRCSQGHGVADAEVLPGLAAKYPGDKGIAKDPDVVFFADFEADGWRDEWSGVSARARSDAVAADPGRKFAPLQGKALSAHLPKGELTALDTRFDFKPKTGAEPEEAFFRYYVRLGDDWNQTESGGKLPGLSGTYGKAGWGGRKANGTNGWSARGYFARTIPDGNPLAGLQPIGNYYYHADMKGDYGDTAIWSRGYRGFLEKNRWYCLEQQVKLNAPGKADGVIRAWVDGRLAFEKTDLRFRTVDALKVERVWMNFYHGGTDPSPHDQHLFVDNVVVARKYVGPMK